MAILTVAGFTTNLHAGERKRLIVLTDFYKDPDDKQSMIRLLTYANEFDVEGLVATSLAYGTGEVHPEWIKDLIDEYGKVLGNLRFHERPGFAYPSVEELKSVVKEGAHVKRKWQGACALSEGGQRPEIVRSRDGLDRPGQRHAGVRPHHPRGRRERRTADLGCRLGRPDGSRPGALEGQTRPDRRSDRGIRQQTARVSDKLARYGSGLDMGAVSKAIHDSDL